MQPAAGLIAAFLASGALAGEPPDAVAGAVQALRDGDIVVLGEIHDNPEHHHTQAAIVAALQPAALVFEMIPQADEDLVNSLREEGADRSAIAEALQWSERGWPSFDFYADILDAAPEARIFGAEQPAGEVQRAMAEGAAVAFGPDAAIYGLDQPLPSEEQAAREAMQAAAHCDAVPVEMLPGMVEAQRFRDAGLADAALWARTMTGDGQVVVIAGSGHADKLRGAPAVIAVADPDLVVRALGQFEVAPDNAAEYDDVLLAPAPERDDPCRAFEPPQ